MHYPRGGSNLPAAELTAGLRIAGIRDRLASERASLGKLRKPLRNLAATIRPDDSASIAALLEIGRLLETGISELSETLLAMPDRLWRSDSPQAWTPPRIDMQARLKATVGTARAVDAAWRSFQLYQAAFETITQTRHTTIFTDTISAILATSYALLSRLDPERHARFLERMRADRF